MQKVLKIGKKINDSFLYLTFKTNSTVKRRCVSFVFGLQDDGTTNKVKTDRNRFFGVESNGDTTILADI